MFNISGSEIVIILLLALIVLGPEKLPDALRRFGRVYGELRRMSQGFQSEVRTAFEEPIREMRETADLTKKAVVKPLGDDAPGLEALDPSQIGQRMKRAFESARPEQSPAEPPAESPAEQPAPDSPAPDDGEGAET
ncbi:MAG: twin-arginine translocase TatA/TatE family subunit [Actinomycetota bacterium]|nr:MAG: twin-arginine translocase TatA/TatE family subunit [Actinomycetota bacterium]